MRLALARHDRTDLRRALVVRIEVVDDHNHVLRVRTADLRRRLGVRERLVLLAADHDEAAAVHELGALDATDFAFDLELHFEAERLGSGTTPVD